MEDALFPESDGGGDRWFQVVPAGGPDALAIFYCIRSNDDRIFMDRGLLFQEDGAGFCG